MIAAPQRGFVFLAMTKCASTAIENELYEHGVIVTRHDPKLKHMNYGGFSRHVAPLLRRSGYKRNQYDVVAVFREPISWLHSWYRYRSRDELANGQRQHNYTGHVSFDEFCHAYMEGTERYAKSVGRQARFVRTKKHPQMVDRIFRFEELPTFVTYLSERLETRLKLDHLNVSPPKNLRLPKSTRERMREFLADEYDIYERLATGERIDQTAREAKDDAGTNGVADSVSVAVDTKVPTDS